MGRLRRSASGLLCEIALLIGRPSLGDSWPDRLRRKRHKKTAGEAGVSARNLGSQVWERAGTSLAPGGRHRADPVATRRGWPDRAANAVRASVWPGVRIFDGRRGNEIARPPYPRSRRIIARQVRSLMGSSGPGGGAGPRHGTTPISTSRLSHWRHRKRDATISQAVFQLRAWKCRMTSSRQ